MPSEVILALANIGRDLNIGCGEKFANAQKFAIFPPENNPAGCTRLDTVVSVDRRTGMSLYLETGTSDDERRLW